MKDSGIITSLDANTGEMLKQGRAIGRGNYYASIVAGDGKEVYLISEGGVVTILKAGRDWSVLGSYDQGTHHGNSVIADGQMLIRTDAALYAFRCK
ncbi:MAG: hypothetical protein U0936_14740 [Planctomycetaceae bacterium]